MGLEGFVRYHIRSVVNADEKSCFRFTDALVWREDISIEGNICKHTAKRKYDLVRFNPQKRRGCSNLSADPNPSLQLGLEMGDR